MPAVRRKRNRAAIRPSCVIFLTLVVYRTIAWSKSGAIASITPDGERLELRFLRAHPETGVWGLSEPTTCDVVRGTPTIPLVHLEWGLAVISELAVFDAVGRVTIVSFPTTLNHGVATRKWDNDPLDDLNAVVGCHWLSVAPGNQQVRNAY